MKEFNFETIKEFDNHISNSILGYDVLHKLIVNLSSFFIKKDTIPIDLGCTTGKLIELISKEYKVNCIGYDITDEQFNVRSSNKLLKQDITDPNFIIPKTNLVFSVFTLQFIPDTKKIFVLKKVYEALHPNGCLIICEKEISNNGQIQECFTFTNYQNKQNNFSEYEILEKEKQLRHTMQCYNSENNLLLLRIAGFKIIEPFFQSLNFKGYLCIK